jgi:hypothetical protein
LKRALAVFLAVLVAKAACAGETAEQRIDSRTFPSVFQAWNPATPLPGKTADEMIALHDLFFTSTGALGLQWIGGEGEGIAFTPASLQAAARKVARLRQLNPHLVILAEIRYRDAPSGFFPDDSPYWMRDASGRRIIGWPEGGYFKIDIGNAKLRALVAQKAAAIAATGFIDGVMLDWWIDDPQRLALIRAVRHAVGDKLILVNGNEGEFPLTAPYVNGTYMECTRHATPQDWSRIAATLRWAEKATHAPHIDCLETWWHTSRQDLALMRATTTLALTESDGYCLFADPDPLPTPDHLHDWYPFWNKGLGRPVAPGVHELNGCWVRKFTGGLVVYNPLGNGVAQLQISQPYRSRATGLSARTEDIAPGDGDILIQPFRLTAQPPG